MVVVIHTEEDGGRQNITLAGISPPALLPEIACINPALPPLATSGIVQRAQAPINIPFHKTHMCSQIHRIWRGLCIVYAEN